jgi:RimJ/RimL family protein N-acetyltransferase
MDNQVSGKWAPPMTFFEFELPFGTVAVRDIEESDIDMFVRYWHQSGDDHLRYLNIDRDALGTPEETYERFRASIRTGDPDQQTVAFAITLDDDPVGGYFNLNRYSPLENYPHFHVMDEDHRAMGGASACMPYGFELLFELFPIERMVLQTRTRVIAINKLLDHFLPVVETVYLEDPDGLAGPGEFNHRYIYRKDVPAFIEKSNAFRKKLLGEDGPVVRRLGGV